MAYPQAIGDTRSLYIVLEPLLDKIDFKRLKINKKRISSLESKLNEAIKEAKNPYLKGRLKKYCLNNKEIKNNLNKLKKYDPIIFITGVSCKPARYGNIPRKIAIDPEADEFFLTDKILERVQQIPEAYENILFWPVSPVMWPFIVRNNKIEHPLPKIIKKINREQEKKGSTTFGALSKSLESRYNKTNYKFYESLFDYKKALNYLIDWSPQLNELFKKYEKIERVEKEIRDISYLNNILMSFALGNIIKLLEPHKVYGYFMETSYCNKIFSLIHKSHNIEIKVLDCMRNARLSPFGECDDSAIDILDGLIRSLHQKKVGKKLKPPKRKKKETIIRISALKCHHYPFYLCANQRNCDKVTIPCAKHLIESLDEEVIELIYKDTTRHHYGIQGIESLIYRLITEDDHYITNSEGIHTSWLKERGNQKIEPLTFKSNKEIIGDLRASELSNKCDIARIISTYHKLIPIKIKKNDFAIVGDGEHKIINTQLEDKFLPNKVLEKIGLRAIKRDNYCEKFIIYRYDGITVTGHLDAAILIGSNIGIIDMKRTYLKDYKYQLLTYALGVNQMLKINPEKYYLIFVHRGYSGEVKDETPLIQVRAGSYREPIFTIMTVKKDGPLIKLLHERIKRVYKTKKKILNDKEEMLIRKSVSKKLGMCETCLSDTKQYCDYLFSRINDYKNLAQFFRVK